MAYTALGTFQPPMDDRLVKNADQLHEDLVMAPARRIAAELVGKNIPAAELTDEQKCALFTLAGYMKLENGRLVSIRPVGISDDGNGKYILQIAPEKP